MKATGIVRRIDELGRVVIPKEIRKTLHIKDGEELEIYTNEREELIIKKYSRIRNMKSVGGDYCAAVENAVGGTALLCDNDCVAAASGRLKKDYIGAPLAHSFYELMNRRTPAALSDGECVDIIIEDKKAFRSQYVRPIVGAGDVFGALVVLTDDKEIKDSVRKVADTAAELITYNLD